MRSLLLFICLLISSASFAQMNITGKWKPVRFDMGGIMQADLKAGTITFSDSLKNNFKADEDPQASEDLMKSLGNIMLEKMKYLQEEYTVTGVWSETNTEQNKTKTGTYVFDPVSGNLTRVRNSKEEKFVISFKDGKMILTGDLESRSGKKGKMVVEYETL